jgi:hypothetical protein
LQTEKTRVNLNVVKNFFGLLIMVLVLFPTLVRADGMIIPKPSYYVDESGQKAVIWHDGKRETLILSTSFSGNAEDFAWIIPVPAKPEVTYSKDELFTALEDYTRPKVQDRYPAPLMGVNLIQSGIDDYSAKVTVVETKKVDIYDVSVLEATDGTALRKWLEDNGYEYPATKDHLLQYYVTRNWYFVAAKISATATDYAGSSLRQGHATPLKISFETAQIVYPLKISGPGAKSADGLKIAAYSFETGLQGWNAGYVYPTPLPLDGGISGSRQVVGVVRNSYVTLAYDPVRHGKNSLQLTKLKGTSVGEDFAYVNVFGLQSGKRYTFSATAMVNKDVDAKVKLRIKSGERLLTETKSESFGPTKQSVKLEADFLADSTSLKFDLVAMGLVDEQSIYWDAVQIEQGESVSNFSYELMPGTTRIGSNSSVQIPIVLYVFSNHKKYIPGFSTEFAGSIKGNVIEKLAIDDNGDPWMKSDKSMYLTKITKRMMQTEMTDDLTIRDANDNNPVGSGSNFSDNSWKLMLIFGVPLALEIAGMSYFWYSKSRKAVS